MALLHNFRYRVLPSSASLVQRLVPSGKPLVPPLLCSSPLRAVPLRASLRQNCWPLGRRLLASASKQDTSGNSLLQRYRAFNIAYPLSAAFIVCFAKGALADFLAQKVYEKRPDLDVRRLLGMSLFSGAYCGVAQHFVYNVIYTKIFGSSQAFTTAIMKTTLDTTVHVPFSYMTVYYCFDELLRHGTLSGVYARWTSEIVGSMTAYAKIWVPWFLFMFMFVPVELRITSIAGVSFIWLQILSVISH